MHISIRTGHYPLATEIMNYYTPSGVSPLKFAKSLNVFVGSHCLPYTKFTAFRSHRTHYQQIPNQMVTHLDIRVGTPPPCLGFMKLQFPWLPRMLMLLNIILDVHRYFIRHVIFSRPFVGFCMDNVVSGKYAYIFHMLC